MKTADEAKPNYGPVYAAALYPELAVIFVRHGYALAVHGSLARDFDLIAVPWVDEPSEIQEILDEIKSTFAVHFLGGWTLKPHGRTAITMTIGHGHCAGDLSFMPTR